MTQLLLRFLLPLVLFGLTLSCNTDKGQQKKTVKKLERQISKLHKTYYEMDVESYAQLQQDMKALADSVTNFVADKTELDENLFNTLGKFVGAQKVISRKLRKTYKPIEADLILTQKQIADLLHDIKNNYIPADSVDTYIRQEAAAVEKIQIRLQDLEQSLLDQKVVYDETLPVLHEFIATQLK